jgi:hypothetical protein
MRDFIPAPCAHPLRHRIADRCQCCGKHLPGPRCRITKVTDRRTGVIWVLDEYFSPGGWIEIRPGFVGQKVKVTRRPGSIHDYQQGAIIWCQA